MAKRPTWKDAVRQQQEKYTAVEPTQTHEAPVAPPGVCSCGNAKFRLAYINRQLYRKCLICGESIIV